MAIVVMLVIIVLNVALLVVIMRLGTQGEHHAEFTADQSGAVLALHDRLGLPHPEPKVAVASVTATKTAKNGEEISTELDEAVADIKGELANAVKDAKDKLSTKEEVAQDDASDDNDDS